MNPIRTVSVVALACSCLAVRASGQEAIEALFSKTESVTISGGAGCLQSGAVTTDHGGCGIYSFGLEALINLSTATPEHPWGMELALGYGQMSGFRSAAADLDLRGAIRSLPSVAAYASREFTRLPLGFDEFYAGVHTGFLRMHNMRAYDGDGRQYAAEGETFEFALSVGLFDESGFFIEPSYSIRYFPSIDWQFPEGVETLPAGWPRSLDLSGPSLSVGYQFSIGSRDDEKEGEDEGGS